MRYLKSLRLIFVVGGILFIEILDCRNARAQSVQWSAAQGGNGHFYEIVSAPSGISWANASLAATNRGGYLVTITSAEENAFVFNLASREATVWYSGYGPWLGGIQPAGSAEPAGGWKWITGEPFTYKNWAAGQPNNNQNEDRIQFGGQADRSSMWNDIAQNNTNYTRGFVVECTRHPNAAALSLARKGTDQVELSWISRRDIPYTIEWTEDLGGHWTVLTNVVGNGNVISVEDLVAVDRRFYRSSAPQ